MDGCLVGVVLFFGGSIAVAFANANSQQKALAAYQASLAKLRENPTDAAQHQRTLALGRAYSNLTRNNKGVTVYDEMALMNDINAACGGAVALTLQQQRQPPPPKRVAIQPASDAANLPNLTATSLEERLARLTRLKEQGMVTNEEYQAKRQQILNEM